LHAEDDLPRESVWMRKCLVARDARVVVIADPDDGCPGMWVEIDPEFGYCSLGDQCRNPHREAHERHVSEQIVDEPDDRPDNP
jgi:hypothetical protein